jgi:hypothetical protein
MKNLRSAAPWLILATCSLPSPEPPPAGRLPARYLELLGPDLAALEEKLQTPELAAKFTTTELAAGLMAEAALWSRVHPANPGAGDPRRRDLGLQFGDLLAEKAAAGLFTQPLNHRWDIHFWADGYRLLRKELGEERDRRWRAELEKQVAPLAADLAERENFPRYQSPFIRTSPNHFSLWGSGVYLAGRALGNPPWESLGARVMHRFAAEEQTPDGYWGEHSDRGPTPGYNSLTLTGVALYHEHSGDPAALEALRRATEFHTHFTWPDGSPVEVINDRNRHWAPGAWGHFGISHFPAGRRLAEFLAGFLKPGKLGPQGVGRLAQDFLYFHEGPVEPIPQDRPRYHYQLSVPAGIRKAGPWTLALSGLIATQAPANQFYLDRQGHLSVFHAAHGLVLSGANSKRQPELATFSETVRGQTSHLPLSSRLRMEESGDRLSLSYNTFWADLWVEPPRPDAIAFRFHLTEMGRVEEARLTLQLILKPGTDLETGKGRHPLGRARLEVEDLGGWIRQGGWTLHVDPSARVVWPVFPFNPYADGPETALEQAVGALVVPVRPARRGDRPDHFRTQEIDFLLECAPAR